MKVRLRLTVYYVKCSGGQPFLFADKGVEHKKKKKDDAVSCAALTSDTVLQVMENALK